MGAAAAAVSPTMEELIDHEARSPVQVVSAFDLPSSSEGTTPVEAFVCEVPDPAPLPDRPPSGDWLLPVRQPPGLDEPCQPALAKLPPPPGLSHAAMSPAQSGM